MILLRFRVLAWWALAAALAALLAGCGSFGGEAEGSADISEADMGRQVEVFYVTDREPSASPNEHFGSERGPLSYGIANIGIPPGHEVGRHEAPSVFKFEWSPDERKHITVGEVRALDKGTFLRTLRERIDLSPQRKVLVFVHGYNVEYAEAARLLAQFATDLKFQGPALLFSWPSQGSLTGYTVDETNAEWAEPHLARLLDDLIDEASAQQIYLVAHSMGARIATGASVALAGDRGPGGIAAIREMILIAPDIDADLFRTDLAPRLTGNGVHVTLYASSGDRALLASKAFHGYARAGESGDELVLVDGVETIDVSAASIGLLGHSYFAEDRRIMEDLYSLLRAGQGADGRFGLQAVTSPKGRYWTFRN